MTEYSGRSLTVNHFIDFLKSNVLKLAVVCLPFRLPHEGCRHCSTYFRLTAGVGVMVLDFYTVALWATDGRLLCLAVSTSLSHCSSSE